MAVSSCWKAHVQMAMSYTQSIRVIKCRTCSFESRSAALSCLGSWHNSCVWLEAGNAVTVQCILIPVAAFSPCTMCRTHPSHQPSRCSEAPLVYEAHAGVQIGARRPQRGGRAGCNVLEVQAQLPENSCLQEPDQVVRSAGPALRAQHVQAV